MKILAIETSCDETAVSVLEAEGTVESATFRVLGNALLSQAALHAAYGGVYPTLAKREHQANLVPLTVKALTDASLLRTGTGTIDETSIGKIREADFRNATAEFLRSQGAPAIDLIAVTHGPGLEPALWTGITFAEALGAAWKIPVMGIDHMEGHIVSALLRSADTTDTHGMGADGRGKTSELSTFKLQPLAFPALALLVSGGHTQFVLMESWFSYKHIGETKDDAVGEAFDKVARLLDLAYPGGPRIAELSAMAKTRLKNAGEENPIVFPRPMAQDGTCDFSFSGLKTAVLYKLKSMEKMSERDKEHIAEAFESAVRDVMVLKTKRALRETKAAAMLMGGGVSANEEIRTALSHLIEKDFPDLPLYLPDKTLTGDNAIMIGAAAFLRVIEGKKTEKQLVAEGNLRLS